MNKSLRQRPKPTLQSRARRDRGNAVFLPVRSNDTEVAFLDARQLKAFLAVVEHGQYGRAADVLGLSKQGMSQSVSALEESLGVRLFERGQFGAIPTTSGRILAQHARAIQSEIRKAQAEIAGLQQQARTEVTFAVGAAFSDSAAPLAIGRLLDKHPSVQVKVANVHPDNMLQVLSEGQLDFVAMGNLAQDSTKNLVQHEIFTTNSRLIVSASHPLAKLRSPSLDDLARFSFIIVWRHDHASNALARAFAGRDLESISVIGCDNFLVTRGLVLDQGRVVLANRMFFRRELERGDVVEIDITGLSYSVTYSLYHRRDAVLNDATLAMMDELKRAALEIFDESPDKAKKNAR